MKKILILVSLLFLPLVTSAQTNPFYIGVNAGYENSKGDMNGTTISSLYDTGFTVWGLSIGADINNYLRAEIAYNNKNGDEEFLDFRDEYGYIYLKDSEEEIKQQTISFNLFYYPFPNLKIKPFIGAGIGLGWVDIEYVKNYQKIAYAGYLGADYKLTDYAVISLTGSFNSTGSNGHFDQTENWGISAGFRYYI